MERTTDLSAINAEIRFMKTVVEPANALEGHMLQDLLRQRGITSRLDGFQLQGGVGELPAAGLVRLVVDDEDYAAARAVIDEWEVAATPDPIPVPQGKPVSGLLWAAAGLVIGIAGTYAYFHVPADIAGYDYNDDGVLDEQWEYSAGGTLVKSTLDRNLDSKVDFIYRYDRRGRALSGESDDNFDGVFESHIAIRGGNFEVIETDTNADSHVDLRTGFRQGVLASVEFLVPGSAAPVRIEHFRLGKLTVAEVDTDRDGRLDTRHQYSDIGGVLSTESIQVERR